MTGYRLTPRAFRDLDQIADFTLTKLGGASGRSISERYGEAGRLAGQKPGAGRFREEIGEGYRQGLPLIFYIVDGDIAAIIGLPHGSMDVDANFQSPA